MFSLKNKSVVITGGGSGIGRAISELFARQGAMVNILELNEKAAEETVNFIKKAGGNAKAFACDIVNQAKVIEVFQEIKQVDILINNAGIAHVGNLENTSESDFNRIFEVNVKGAYNCLYVAVPMMKANGGGVILNMASVVATVGIADRFAYSMSKGAILTMTLSIAKDYIKDNIRCNCISPARVHTPFVDGFLAKNYPDNQAEMWAKLSATQPIGRMAKPEEIASLALYLCSDEAGFVTGSDYPIDGGFTRLNN
ncbi:MAG: SDR family oxidoreductase [Arcicella sp.]|nr:SDR family oxidoreductase [Arcicella sp.]